MTTELLRWPGPAPDAPRAIPATRTATASGAKNASRRMASRRMVRRAGLECVEEPPPGAEDGRPHWGILKSANGSPFYQDAALGRGRAMDESRWGASEDGGAGMPGRVERSPRRPSRMSGSVRRLASGGTPAVVRLALGRPRRRQTVSRFPARPPPAESRHSRERIRVRRRPSDGVSRRSLEPAAGKLVPTVAREQQISMKCAPKVLARRVRMAYRQQYQRPHFFFIIAARGMRCTGSPRGGASPGNVGQPGPSTFYHLRAIGSAVVWRYPGVCVDRSPNRHFAPPCQRVPRPTGRAQTAGHIGPRRNLDCQDRPPHACTPSPAD